MIKIEFTCYKCGGSSEIEVDDVEEKVIVPVCDACYELFLSQKGKLVKSFRKKLKSIYWRYSISDDTFNAAEELADL